MAIRRQNRPLTTREWYALHHERVAFEIKRTELTTARVKLATMRVSLVAAIVGLLALFTRFHVLGAHLDEQVRKARSSSDPGTPRQGEERTPTRRKHHDRESIHPE